MRLSGCHPVTRSEPTRRPHALLAMKWQSYQTEDSTRRSEAVGRWLANTAEPRGSCPGPGRTDHWKASCQHLGASSLSVSRNTAKLLFY